MEPDKVTIALLGLRSKVPAEQVQALEIIEKTTEDDTFACDLLRRNGCTNLLVRLARSEDATIADRAAAALAAMCGETSRGESDRVVTIEGLRVTLHELPYVLVGVGYKTWASAFALVSLVAKEEVNVKELDVLELGCGTGLVGIACGLLGARSLLLTLWDDSSPMIDTLTDYLPDIVTNAAVNVRTNGLSATCTTALLDWTTAPATPDKSTWSRYLLIMGADVIYASELVQPLISAIAASLLPAGTAHIVLQSPATRYGVTEFEKEASTRFRVAKRALLGRASEELAHYVLTWPINS